MIKRNLFAALCCVAMSVVSVNAVNPPHDATQLYPNGATLQLFKDVRDQVTHLPATDWQQREIELYRNTEAYRHTRDAMDGLVCVLENPETPACSG